MFWDKWIPKKYFVKSEICAIEVTIREEETIYYYTHLKNKGKKLEIAEFGSFKNEVTLPTKLEKSKTPLIIIINGKGVILKKVSLPENNEFNIEEVIIENLPAINPHEFFIQLFKTGIGGGYISLVRKDIINNLLFEFKKKKYEVADVLIGAPSVYGLRPLWSSFNNLQTSLQHIELINEEIDFISASTSHKKEQINIENISFSPDHTLGFAGGVSYLMQGTLAINHNKDLKTLYQTHVNRNKIKFLMILCVGVIFVLSVINVFFYTSLFDKDNRLENELTVYQGKYDQINKLLNDYQKKKNLIENAGVLSINGLSEYADKIAKTIPDEVVLTEMSFNPKVSNEDSEDSMIVFGNKHIIIKGNCNKSLIINEWVNVLKMQNFIKEVTLEQFTYNSEGFLPNYEIRILTE